MIGFLFFPNRLVKEKISIPPFFPGAPWSPRSYGIVDSGRQLFTSFPPCGNPHQIAISRNFLPPSPFHDVCCIEATEIIMVELFPLNWLRMIRIAFSPFFS